MDTSIYNDLSYFISFPEGHEQVAWETCQLRYGSQADALGYALGIRSWEEVRSILQYQNYGHENIPVVGAKRQCELLWNVRTRVPKGIVEIGGGRGELSVCAAYLGIKTYMIEPSEAAPKLLAMTKDKFGMGGCYPVLVNKNIYDAFFGDVSWGDNTGEVDTVVLVETIEHIYPEDFDPCFEIIRHHLKKNGGLFIVTNWITYWPIPYGAPWHVRVCDDYFYNQLAEGGEVVYRNGSHLVVRY